MKLQSLAVIFIIIIMPITMVLSEYINNKIKTQETELLYDTRLLNCTFDAIKAYQLNTINNEFGDVTNKKIEDIQAAAKTFFNSLSSSFNYTGYNSEVMKEYVPAVVFTMYDGYYTYSPFLNVLTNVGKADESNGYDSSYSKDGEKLEGLKPYVYYSCRYTNENASTNLPDNTDFTIVYTLDNYITIQGMINGEYVYDYGYLYSIANSENEEGIYKDGEHSYWYDGVKFTDTDTEELKEYVGKDEYSYAKINGKKYYLDEKKYTDRDGDVDIGDGMTVSKKAGIFYISSTTGEKNYSQNKGYLEDSTEEANNNEFIKYCKAIKKNKSAYEYYKNAYEFSSAVLGTAKRFDKANIEHTNGYNLKDLRNSDAYIYNNASSDTTSLKSWGDMKIFDDPNNAIQNAGSNFNQHRKAVIRNVIETNLTSAIASFSSGATNVEFIMPKISEEDWETIENDVCAISFMQGMSIGSKKYNGYSVVANTLTKEYVDENDIYILAQDTNGNIYCKVNDAKIGEGSTMKKKGTGAKDLPYYPGIWKINFESKQYIEGGQNKIYVPIKDYAGSYTSIMGSYAVNPIGEDMYTYVHEKGTDKLKEIYYKALGRERWGAYNVNNINYEIYKGNGEEYFLNSY